MKQVEETSKLVKGKESSTDVTVSCVKTNCFKKFSTNEFIVQSDESPVSEIYCSANFKPSFRSALSSADVMATKLKSCIKTVKTADCLQGSTCMVKPIWEKTSEVMSIFDSNPTEGRKGIECNNIITDFLSLKNTKNLDQVEKFENSSSSSEFEFLEAECEVSEDKESKTAVVNILRDQSDFPFLTPIQENDEHSSNSFDNQSIEIGKHNFHKNELRILSSSLYVVSTIREHEDPLCKSQTFPRSKISTRRQTLEHDFDLTLYPLEPRELDPFCFNQLHAADSQEELQEFLLLESECMVNDERRGLAAAFTPPESD